VSDAIATIDHPEDVLDIVDRILLKVRLVSNRIPLVSLGEDCHVTVEGGREENRLTLTRSHLKKATHRGEKAHVGHPVGLVDDHEVDVTKVDVSLGDEIFQSSGASHQKIDTLVQLASLWAVADSPIDGGHRTVGSLGQRSKLGGDLLRKLSSWRQDQAAWSTGLAPTDPGHKWKAKGEGFSRAGGGAPAYIAPGENVGDGEGLDWEGRRDVATFKNRYEMLGYAELGEGSGHDCSPFRLSGTLGCCCDLASGSPLAAASTRSADEAVEPDEK